MTVSDTIQAEALSDFFKNLGKKGPNASKKWLKMISETFHERWISQQTLLQQLQTEILKM